ncbi:hypothetical protein QUF70_14780, partial [Desulfobacterales bacterium HSG17]|nr:hypothetical protein [Desulfobacterales bacterium HSG17]
MEAGFTRANLGVFILWVGWFGFNAGSTTSADTSIAMIAVNTNLAAAAGAIAAGAILAMIISWIKFGKPEVSMSLNGALAGLLGITAGCDSVSPGSSIIIGAVAGVLIVVSVLFIDKLKIDEPNIILHRLISHCGELGHRSQCSNNFFWVFVRTGIVFASESFDSEGTGTVCAYIASESQADLFNVFVKSEIKFVTQSNT